jgi:outer membrane protein assembly factor BamB
MTFDTGDEVKHVATADLDGDGIDEILATSDNGYLYCFGANGKLRWLHHLPNAATALTTMILDGHQTVIAGTSGDIFAFDADGKLVRKSTFESAISQLAIAENNLIAANADGHLVELGR